MRISGDLYGRGVALCSSADRILACAIAENESLMRVWNVVPNSDFQKAVYDIRRGERPGMKSGPMQEAYVKACHRIG